MCMYCRTTYFLITESTNMRYDNMRWSKEITLGIPGKKTHLWEPKNVKFGRVCLPPSMMESH